MRTKYYNRKDSIKIWR